MSELQALPHSIEAEQSVLGGLLLDNDAWERVAGIVTARDFYRDDHRRIYRHIGKLMEKNRPADMVTVFESIEQSEDQGKTGGLAYLGALAQNTPSAHNIRRYAEIVRENAERRNLAAIGLELYDKASTPGADALALKRDTEEKLDPVNAGMVHDWQSAALDLEVLAEREPELPRFIIPDWLPAGYATLLAGHGGIGKSAIALHLAVCTAAGVPFFGLEVSRRRVLYLSCEDREAVLHWRLSRICAHLGIDLARLRGWLEILDLVGRNSVLFERDLRTGNVLTAAYGALDECMRKYQAELLIVDGISDVYGGNENARAEVKRFVNGLVALIPPDTGAVLLVGHVAKMGSTAGANGEGYSGSTGWHNSVRARWYLYPETNQGEDAERTERTGDLILDLQKSNMGRTDQSMRFAWDDDAHLFVGREIAEASHLDRTHREREEKAGILAAFKGCHEAGISVPAAMQGPRTAYLVLSLRPEFPESLRKANGATRGRFRRRIEELRQIRAIEECEYRRSNGHKTAALGITTEGLRQYVE